MIFYLHPRLQSFFLKKNLFDQLMSLTGKKFREQDGRVTQRIKLGERYYFIKQHYGVGYKEIFKNLIQGRLPIVSAQNEWRAILKLHQLGISAAKVVGYGQRGLNPANLQSFVLMEEIQSELSLEEYCQKKCLTFHEKKRLMEKLANIARIMHDNGINHRDFYLCHFLLDAKENLHVIDLHRAGFHKKLKTRWIIKDLAALLFSAKSIQLTKSDLYRFMQFYRQNLFRQIWLTEKNFWMRIYERSEKLYTDHRPR